MFGSSNPFGQSSSSPFGSQTVFGQAGSANNPFAPKPFGSTTPFGSPAGGSIFGSTPTGVFGATQSSPFGSTTTFGVSSTPAFGSSTPAFGASITAFGGSTPAFGASTSPSFGGSTPAFGASTSPAFGSSTPAFGASTPAFGSLTTFGGSSLFGQKPAFGGFGSAASQPSFGSTFQQSTPASGSNLFGSTAPFGASSPSPFGATSASPFGSSTTTAFGTTNPFGVPSSPVFGVTSTPGFGSTSAPALGSSPFGASSAPAFGSIGAFGASNTGSSFGLSTTPAFGTSTVSAFGGTNNPFGAPSTPLFSSSATPFGVSSSTPSFGFGSSSAFGQSTPTYGSNPFGSTAQPFGVQSSPLGAQSTTPAFGNTGFGQSAFGGQRGGTRVISFTPTLEATDPGTSTQATGKLESISAMPVYKEKSHEELRWEDYQLGDKGGKNQPVQSGFGAPTPQVTPFGNSAFGQSSSSLFNTTAPNMLTTSAFGASSTASPFSSTFGVSTTPNIFSSSAPATSSLFGMQSSNLFTSTSSMFNSASTSPFGVGSSSSIFGPSSGQGAFGSGFVSNTQSSPLFQSTTPSFGPTGSMFGQTTPQFGQNLSSPFGQPGLFSAPNFSSTPSLSSSNPVGFSQPSPFSMPFQPTQPVQTAGTSGFASLGQMQPGASGFGTFSTNFGQSFGQSPALPSPVVVQPPPISNPFGTLPAPLQMSIGRPGISPSLHYGISSMPVSQKPPPTKISPLLTSRHVSQRRIRLPPRRYHPNDGPKIPFFEDVSPSTTKADDTLFIPKENPRALVIKPPLRPPVEKDYSVARQNGDISEPSNIPELDTENGRLQNGHVKGPRSIIKQSDGIEDAYTANRKGDSSIVPSENGVVKSNGEADMKSIMPILRHADYYSKPRIQELKEKEKAEPGFCQRVKDFMVGRDGFGKIKFLGETDVRGLDLESIIQFTYREVNVYPEEEEKPPVGQGLNKPAEVTLFNVKCFDKETGEQHTEGPKLERFRGALVRRTKDLGARLLVCDPVKGIWKFRVDNF